jgi:undecaprenyl-diphosphatase
MLAVIGYFRVRILQTLRGLVRERSAQGFALQVIVAFMPAAVLGLAIGSWVKAYLFQPVPVAIAFIVGGFVILWVETRQARNPHAVRVQTMDDMSLTDAFKVGLAQCFALIPGTSRSGATIIGGMIFGLSRKAATEFTFYLAIPTLIAAGAYDSWKQRDLLSMQDLPLFAVGLAVSFASALACVHWLMRYVASHDFRVFAWYRIGFGLLVLITAWTGLVDWQA